MTRLSICVNPNDEQADWQLVMTEIKKLKLSELISFMMVLSWALSDQREAVKDMENAK